MNTVKSSNEYTLMHKKTVNAFLLRVLSTLTYGCIFFLVAIVSNVLLEYYYQGDQIHYTNFYYEVQGASLVEIPGIQIRYTGSAEPLFGLTIWLASSFLEKNVFVSLVNGLGGIILLKAMLRANISIFVFPLIFMNYYLMVVLIPAERLKFALIFLALAFISSGKNRFLFLAIAPLFHLQSLIFVVIYIIYAQLEQIRNLSTSTLFSRMRNFLGIALLITIGVSLVSQLQRQVILKLSKYETYEISEVIEIFILFGLAFAVSRDRWAVLWVFMPLAFSSYVLGGDRVNMIGFIIFLFFMARWKKCLEPISIGILGYFVYKNYHFVERFTTYGTGFS